MQGDHNQPLPPEFDWDNMKEGIFDKIQSLEQEQAPQKRKDDSRKRVGFILFLFSSLILGLFLRSQNFMQDPGSETLDVIQLSGQQENPTASDDIEKSTLPIHMASPTAPNRDTHQNLKEKDRLTTHIASESHQVVEKSATTQTDIKQSPTNDPIHEIDPLNKFQNIDRIEATPGKNSSAHRDFAHLSKIELLGVRCQTPGIQALSTSPMSLESTLFSTVDIPTDTISYPATDPKQSPHQLILEGGPAFWNQGYGKNKPASAQYEVPILSFQLQGHYMRNLKSNYFMMIGLQYQQLESRFQYSKTIEDYPIILEDTVLQVRNNVVTGDQTIRRGDVETSVLAERSVQHYNTSRLFKLSMGMGKSWRFRSFQADAYLGGTLNSWVRNQGRTLSNDEVVDYNGASNSLFQNQFTAEGILGTRLHYDLNPKLALIMGFQAQKSLMNWSKQNGIHQYPASIHLLMGLKYTL
ncbi:MAG: hypothetical protein AAFW00_17995 [Bacteroidota bacterium]